MQKRLASPLTRFPVVADFHRSSAFGTSLQEEASPTITKTRARGKALWLIDKVRFGSLQGVLAKRSLDVSDHAALQGWDKAAQVRYLENRKQPIRQ